MKLKARTLLEQDYTMLEKWWLGWGWPVVNKEILPDNGTGGVMIEHEGKPIVAGFIYWSNSGMCWFDWVISDPKGNKRARPFAVKFLIETVEKMVKDAGKKCIMSISRSNSLLKIHKKLGWTIDKTPSHEMIKRII
tara:strand:+ start:999 stop:1406 length:408 start_codon:yes stop_codon:yes gene_type:complete